MRGGVAGGDVACDDGLEERDVVVARDGTPPCEVGVRGHARGDAVPARPLVDAGVDLLARANRLRALVGVDCAGVAVEDVADLLARKRLDRALRKAPVGGVFGREAEFLADAGDLVRAHAAAGKRADEGVLHRQYLLVGERDGVLAPPRDVVVDLDERGFARKLHLAGVVLAVRDVLELLEGDVDVGEVDGRHSSDE